MMRSGMYKKIDLKEIKNLTIKQIQQRYAVSRSTAWRWKTRRVRYGLVKLEPDTQINAHAWQVFDNEKVEEKINMLKRKYKYVDIEIIKDIVYKNRLKFVQYYNKLETDVQYRHKLLYIWSDLDIKSYLQSKNKKQRFNKKILRKL